MTGSPILSILDSAVHYRDAFQATSCFMFAIVSLARASHMTKPSIMWAETLEAVVVGRWGSLAAMTEDLPQRAF